MVEFLEFSFYKPGFLRIHLSFRECKDSFSKGSWCCDIVVPSTSNFLKKVLLLKNECMSHLETLIHKEEKHMFLLVSKTSLFLFMSGSFFATTPWKINMFLRENDDLIFLFKKGWFFLGSILVNLPGWFITAFQLESFLKQTLRSQDSSIPSWKASHWPSAQSYTCRLQPPWQCCENPRSRWSSWAESHGGLKPEKIPSIFWGCHCKWYTV